MRCGGSTAVGDIVRRESVPSIDYSMSVETAAALMAEEHLEAVSVTKGSKVSLNDKLSCTSFCN